MSEGNDIEDVSGHGHGHVDKKR